MSVDRLDSLLARFSVSASMFHSGPLCGINEIAPRPGTGQLHLIRRGPVTLMHAGSPEATVEQPSVLFYPRPLHHRFMTDPQRGADMACADIVFNAGASSPLAQALPPFVLLPLAELERARPVLDLLFDEAFAQRCGRRAVVDRLFEVVLIELIRHLLDRRMVHAGALAGLAHPRLAPALVAVHEAPAEAWTLATLAKRAGLSRSAFAPLFRTVVGQTVGDYLAAWRIGLAMERIGHGEPLKRVADDVGYGSVAALSRAFKARMGASPRAWRARERPVVAPGGRRDTG